MQGPSNYDLRSFSFPLISGISLGFVLWPINIKSYEPLIQVGGRKDLWWGQGAMLLWKARGVAKPPCRKWTTVFRPIWKPFPVTYYKVYLPVFICRKLVISPCINADSWEKDVQLHFVSGTKFYHKNICHIVICMHGLRGRDFLPKYHMNLFLVKKYSI